MRNWLVQLNQLWTQQRRGILLPQSYTILDIETTGFSRSSDFITQFAWAFVVERRVHAATTLYLDWRRHPGVDPVDFTNRVNRVTEVMASNNRIYHPSIPMLDQYGTDPMSGLQMLIQTLQTALASNIVIVGHGLLGFDKPHIDAAGQRFLPHMPIDWDRLDVRDTGMMEVAAALNIHPTEGHTTSQWFDHVGRGKGRTKWNLDQHVSQKYNLRTRYPEIQGVAHDATVDCYMVWGLMETYREIMEGRYVV